MKKDDRKESKAKNIGRKEKDRDIKNRSINAVLRIDLG
jgi:hypothetical protein